MISQTLYIKHRPKCLSDIIGQDHVISLLRKRISTNQIGGAYLLIGPSGCGKTSTAFALCGELDINDMCYGEILSQSCSVEDVRDMQISMSMMPWIPNSYQLRLVDEAHTLSTPARNVFLSLLERLPERCIIIFTTTQKEAFDDVWDSRCKKLYFNEPSRKTIAILLRKIAEAEGFPKFKTLSLAHEISENQNCNLRTALQMLEDELLSPGSFKTAIKKRNSGRIRKIKIGGLE